MTHSIIHVALVFAVCAGSAVAEVRYTVTDLGTLGGGSASAWDINNSCQVTGISECDPLSSLTHAFFWQSGTMTDLGVSGAGDYAHKFACSINKQGIVAGTVYDTDDWGAYGVIFDGRQTTYLPLYTGADAINDAGHVAGIASNGGSLGRASLWIDNQMTDLGTLGGPESGARGINNDDHVVGWSFMDEERTAQHAFLWENGAMIDIGTLGGNSSEAWGINDQGQVVGDSGMGNGYWHAFLWQDGTMVDLSPSFAGFSKAYDINESGDIVGYGVPDGTEAHFACLWENDGMIDVNDMINPEAGWNLLETRAINDEGYIVGEGILNGQHRPFMLTPVPEPATFLLLCVGFFVRRRLPFGC